MVRARDRHPRPGLLQSWLELLVGVTRQAEAALGPLGPFPPEELAALVGQAFLGGESLLLLGFDRRRWPVRAALRRVGLAIRELEEARRKDATLRPRTVGGHDHSL